MALGYAGRLVVPRSVQGCQVAGGRLEVIGGRAWLLMHSVAAGWLYVTQVRGDEKDPLRVPSLLGLVCSERLRIRASLVRFAWPGAANAVGSGLLSGRQTPRSGWWFQIPGIASLCVGMVLQVHGMGAPLRGAVGSL